MAAMIDEGDRDVSDIKDALRTMFDGDLAALESDLWPRMRARLRAPSPRPSVLEWALAAALGAAALMFPQIMLGVLYHL
jgi:hypothetical protein